MLEKRTGIDIPDAKPLVEFSTNELAKIVTTITVFCPTDRINALEKEMVREFFAWYRTGRRTESDERERSAERARSARSARSA